MGYILMTNQSCVVYRKPLQVPVLIRFETSLRISNYLGPIVYSVEDHDAIARGESKALQTNRRGTIKGIDRLKIAKL